MVKNKIKSEFQLDTKGAIENIKRLKKELNTLTSVSKLNERFGKEGIKIPSSRLNKNELSNQANNLHLKEKATRESNVALKEQNRLERISKRNQREMDKLFNEISRVKQKNLKAESKAQMLVAKAKKYNNDQLLTSKGYLKQNRGALMGIGFAALFGGMAIKRFTQGALKDWINAYSEAMGKTSEFNVMTNKLTGAWTFFKFSLIDALMQTGLFQNFMDFIISAVHGIGEFAALHPKIAAMLPILFAIGVILGTIAMIAGQVGLALLSFFLLSEKGFKITLPLAIANFGKGFYSAFKDLFKNVSKWFGSFYKTASGWLKKLGLKTKYTTAEMIGRFMGFALAGALIGKLFYTLLTPLIEKTTIKGSKQFEIFINAIGFMIRDGGKEWGKVLLKVGTLLLGILTINPALIATGLSNLKSSLNNAIDKISWKDATAKAKKFVQTQDDMVENAARFKAEWELINKQFAQGKISEKELTRKQALWSDLVHQAGLDPSAVMKVKSNEELLNQGKKTASLISAIASTAASGLIGFSTGGGLGALGMSAGAGLTTGISAFNDIKDLSGTINPQLNLDTANISKTNDEIKEINKSQLDENEKSNIFLDKINESNKTIAEAFGGTLEQFKNIVSSTLD